MITYGTKPLQPLCGYDFDVSALSDVRASHHRPVRLGAEAHAQRELAALEQERQLAHRQRQRALPRPLPRRREVPGLEALAEQAQARGGEVQGLGPLPRPADDDEDVARGQALLHRPLDQRPQRVVRVAHVHRLPVDEHAAVPNRAEDHDILRSSSARLSTSRPSTTRPLGACATRKLPLGAADPLDHAGDATRTIRKPAPRPRSFFADDPVAPRLITPSRSQRQSVVSWIPSAAASSRAVVPAPRSSFFNVNTAVRTLCGAPPAVGVLAAIAAFSSATFDCCSSVIIGNLLARARTQQPRRLTGIWSGWTRARTYSRTGTPRARAGRSPSPWRSRSPGSGRGR